jgi:hypothetical protein
VVVVVGVGVCDSIVKALWWVNVKRYTFTRCQR